MRKLKTKGYNCHRKSIPKDFRSECFDPKPIVKPRDTKTIHEREKNNDKALTSKEKEHSRMVFWSSIVHRVDKNTMTKPGYINTSANNMFRTTWY